MINQLCAARGGWPASRASASACGPAGHVVRAAAPVRPDPRPPALRAAARARWPGRPAGRPAAAVRGRPRSPAPRPAPDPVDHASTAGCRLGPSTAADRGAADQPQLERDRGRVQIVAGRRRPRTAVRWVSTGSTGQPSDSRATQTWAAARPRPGTGSVSRSSAAVARSQQVLLTQALELTAQEGDRPPVGDRVRLAAGCRTDRSASSACVRVAGRPQPQQALDHQGGVEIGQPDQAGPGPRPRQQRFADLGQHLVERSRPTPCS